MTFTIQNTLEGGAEGAAATVANLGLSGAAPSFVSGTSMTFAAAAAKHGTRGLRYTYDATTTGAQRPVWQIAAELARSVMDVYNRFFGAFAVEDIMGYRSASAGVAYLHLDGTGHFYAADATGAGIAGSNSTATVPVGSYYRAALAATPGTTTSNGSVAYAVWIDGETTPSITWSTTTANTGTVGITQLCLGRSTTRTVNRVMDYDTFRAQTLTSGWLAEYVPPAPSVSVSLSSGTSLRAGKTQSLTATVTDPGAVVSSLVFSQSSGPSVALSGSGNSRTYTIPATLSASSLAFKVSARDSNGTELAIGTTTHSVLASDIRGKSGGVLVGGYVRGGTVRPGKATVPPVITDPTSGRLTGSQYVMAESLPRWSEFAPTSTRDGDLRGLTAAYAGAGKVLNVDVGKFSGPNFSTPNAGSAADVENGWRGLVGAGKGTIFGYPSSGFTKGTPPTTAGSTNPMHTLQVGVTSRKTLEVGNFSLNGNAGHPHGGLRVSNDLSAANEALHIWPIWGDDGAPGNNWSPPGETFLVNPWRVKNVMIDSIIAEGRNNSSSPLGFNNATDVRVKYMWSNQCLYGMPTCWLTKGNILLDEVVTLGGHIGLNLENVGGTIIVGKLTAKPNRTQLSNGNAMHATFQSNRSAYVADRIEFHDLDVDTGLKGGCFMLMSSRSYTVAGGDNGSSTQLQQASRVHVYRRRADGTEYELTMQDTSVAGNASPDVTKYWYLYR